MKIINVRRITDQFNLQQQSRATIENVLSINLYRICDFLHHLPRSADNYILLYINTFQGLNQDFMHQ